jgi:hypothetical protein
MGGVPFGNESETFVGNQFISKHAAFFNHPSNTTFYSNPTMIPGAGSAHTDRFLHAQIAIIRWRAPANVPRIAMDCFKTSSSARVTARIDI